jgi:hypothetical protein
MVRGAIRVDGVGPDHTAGKYAQQIRCRFAIEG